MKKKFKIILSIVCVIVLLFALGGCNNQQPDRYMYGVIRFEEVDGETYCIAYVPADYCGDIRVHIEVDYITYPENMQSGDLVKMTFSGNPQIQQGAKYQFFNPSPTKIEVLGSGLKIEKSGESYILSFPIEKVEGITENSAVIDLYTDQTLIYNIDNFYVTDSVVVATIEKNNIFNVLQNYGGNFIAR